MAIDFPNSPDNGQTFTSDTRTWTYNGSVWNLTSYGTQGPQGAQGAQGQGLASGGTTGQVLVKSSGTNYDTAWEGGEWTSWTPAVTAVTTDPSLGSGGFLNTTGAYIKIGKTVMGWATIIAGNTSVTAGSGNYMFSLPVTPIAEVYHQQLGSANVASQSPYFGMLRISADNTTKATIIINNAAVSSTTGAIAGGTQIRYHFTYEVA